MGMPSKEDIEKKLVDALKATDVVVLDTSNGCGSSFTVAVVSPLFEGQRLLARHKLINAALQEEMKSIHALSIKKCWTPAQQAAETAK